MEMLHDENWPLNEPARHCLKMTKTAKNWQKQLKWQK